MVLIVSFNGCFVGRFLKEWMVMLVFFLRRVVWIVEVNILIFFMVVNEVVEVFL